MRLSFRCAVPALFLVLPCAVRAQEASPAWRHFSAQSKALLADLNRAPLDPPAAADGVVELKFSEFFGPIGDRGLEYSEKLRALAGHRVRLVGYIAREQVHAPRVCLFVPWPILVESTGLCYYDDLPPATVHVIARGAADHPLPFRPGRLALTGTLEIGPRLEADGRNSSVRLVLDAAGLAALAGANVPRTPAAAAAH